MTNAKYSTSTWHSHSLNPKIPNDSALSWIFVVDLLNFSFWSPRHVEKYTVTYNNQSYTGYWTLCACINRALDNNIPITLPAFYAKISINQLSDIFRPDSETMHPMPLLKERLRLLNTAGDILLNKYHGSVTELVQSCDKSAQKFIQILVEEFNDIFDDSSNFKGNNVYFMKRAQIMCADIWACFDGKGIGEFNDIDTLTIFADYRIPQALVFYGILEYSTELMKMLEMHASYHSRTEFVECAESEEETNVMPRHHEFEVEIRAASIWACELLRKAVDRKDKINSILLDFYIWDFTTQNREMMDKIPFHRTRSIYY